MLDRLGRPKDALAAYDEAIARFGDATEPAVREQAAKALVHKGIILANLGRSDLIQ